VVHAVLANGLRVTSPSLMHHPYNAGVVATTDFAAACKGVSVAVMCGGVPRRGPGMSKAQLMAANCAIYRNQAAALAAYAEPGVKVNAGTVT
jgi:malate/lactate dehydrogenase